MFAGLFYALGLWLQAWGTRYTTASNSAFITGLNVLFVHLFVALYYRRYNRYLFLGLVLGLTGLYLLSSPGSPTSYGDLLVLLGAFMWAGQVLVVDKYSQCDPFIFVFYMFTPTLLFILGDLYPPSPPSLDTAQILVLVYLALFCNIGAFTLQVYGQRRIPPETTATIFLLEPVFATILAHITLAETMNPKQLTGATLILLSTYTTTRTLNSRKTNTYKSR